MKLEITTLVENTGGEHHQLLPEHGLSFYIREGEHCLLFDTGASDRFIVNADLLSLDLAAVEKVLISHGHYDHSGGLRAFVERENGATLVVKPGFFNKKYGVTALCSEYLGNGFTREELVGAGVTIECIHEDVREIVPGVFSVSGFNRTCAMEVLNPRFRVKKNGSEILDDFSDEQVVVIQSSKGLVVILGCSHPGLINILTTIKERFKERIYAVVGGTHLVEADEDRLEKTMDYLLIQDIPVIGISHCSGGTGHLNYIESRLKDRFFHNSTGTRFVV